MASDFAQAGQAGGYEAATAEEIAPGSHCFVLASYAIEQIKAQSNSLTLMQKSCAYPEHGVPTIIAAAARAHRNDSSPHLSLLRVSLPVDKVLSMEHQVVAGTNYRIRAHLQPSGLMSLSVFEQPWTQTLEVTEATLTPSDDSSAITTLVGASSHLRLDAAEFAKRLEMAQP
jgi:hypothetical protein